MPRRSYRRELHTCCCVTPGIDYRSRRRFATGYSAQQRFAAGCQLSRDRLNTDDYDLRTDCRHAGVRREGVTVAAGRLQMRSDQLRAPVSSDPGARKKLEGAACECYRVVNEFHR